MMEEELCYGGKSHTPKEILIKAIDLLSKQCPSNLEINEANKNIMGLMGQSQILDILVHYLIDMDDDDKKSKLILSFISTYIGRQVKSGINVVRHKKWEVYEKIRGVFLLGGIKRCYKDLLEHSYIKFIHASANYFVKIRADLTSFTIKYFQNCQFTTAVTQVENGLHFIRVLLYGSCSLENDALVSLEQSLLIKFLTVSTEMVKDLYERAYSDLNPFSSQIAYIEKILSVTRLIFCRADQNKMPLLKQQASTSQCFYSLVQRIINLKLPKQRGFLTPHRGINAIKEEIFIMLNECLKSLFKRIKSIVVQRYQNLFILSKDILQKVLPMILADVENYPEIPLISEKCMVEGILALSWVIRNPHFFEEVFQLRDIIFFHLCFKLQSPKAQDLKLDPEELFHMKENMIKSQCIKGVNDASEKIIQAYADRVDGSVSYIWTATLNFMDFQLSSEAKYLEKIPERMKESYFFKKLELYKQFETCLQMLASLSYHGQDRKDLITLLQQFIVRRQDFFCRMDAPPTLIACFLLCYSYYQENFHTLIQEGKANYVFHRNFLFHAHELLKATFDPKKKSLIPTIEKIIGLAVRDFFSCLIVQKNFLEVLFPSSDPQSESILINFFKQFTPYLDSDFNLYIVEDILLEFVKQVLRSHFKSGLNSIPLMIRSGLCFELAREICEKLHTKIMNYMICKTKILELLKMLFLLTNDPIQLMKSCLPTLLHIANNQIPNLSDVLELLKLFFRRIEEMSQQSLQREINEALSEIVLKASSIVEDEAFQNVFFVLLHLNLERINPDATIKKLITIFQERVEELVNQNDSDPILIRVMYLMIQISIVSFSEVSGNLWIHILDLMLKYLKEHYVNQNFLIGKITTLCLCIYRQNALGVQNYLGHRKETFWDCILEDPQKYTMIDKRITCIKLLQLITLSPAPQSVSNKIAQILKTCSVLLYCIHEKEQQEWALQGESDMESQQQDGSEGDRKQPWEEQVSSLKENIFTKKLPNQIIMMRDICHQFNRADTQNFRRFISSLPIATQNLVKNKIYNYDDSNHRELRTIVRLKKHS